MFLLTICGYFSYQYKQEIASFTEEFIAKSSGAVVQKIVVEGAVYTPKNELAAALQLIKGDSLVGFQASAARARLEALPWVRLAAVERRLPSTVKVDIYEHQPLARLQQGDAVWVMNKEGKKIVKATEEFDALPLLLGEDVSAQAAHLFVWLLEKPNLSAQLKTAEYVSNRRWNLAFKSGVLVKLPKDNPQKALNMLEKLDASRHVLTLAGGVVDLRLEDRITLRIPENVGSSPVLEGVKNGA